MQVYLEQSYIVDCNLSSQSDSSINEASQDGTVFSEFKLGGESDRLQSDKRDAKRKSFCRLNPEDTASTPGASNSLRLSPEKSKSNKSDSRKFNHYSFDINKAKLPKKDAFMVIIRLKS